MAARWTVKWHVILSLFIPFLEKSSTSICSPFQIRELSVYDETSEGYFRGTFMEFLFCNFNQRWKYCSTIAILLDEGRETKLVSLLHEIFELKSHEDTTFYSIHSNINLKFCPLIKNRFRLVPHLTSTDPWNSFSSRAYAGNAPFREEKASGGSGTTFPFPISNYFIFRGCSYDIQRH